MVTLVKKNVGLSTLRTRAVQFPMERGILSGVMTLMKAKGIYFKNILLFILF